MLTLAFPDGQVKWGAKALSSECSRWSNNGGRG